MIFSSSRPLAFKITTAFIGLLLSSSVFAVAINSSDAFLSVRYLGATNLSNPGGTISGLTVTAESSIIDSGVFVDSFESPVTGTANLSQSTTPPGPIALVVGDTVDLQVAASVSADGRETVASVFSILDAFLAIDNFSNNLYSVNFALTFSANTTSSVTGPEGVNAFGNIQLFAVTNIGDLIDVEYFSGAECPCPGGESDGVAETTIPFSLTLFSQDSRAIILSAAVNSDAESVPLPSSLLLLLPFAALLSRKNTGGKDTG